MSPWLFPSGDPGCNRIPARETNSHRDRNCPKRIIHRVTTKGERCPSTIDEWAECSRESAWMVDSQGANGRIARKILLRYRQGEVWKKYAASDRDTST